MALPPPGRPATLWFGDLERRLEALASGEISAPCVDPRAAALRALVVADHLARPELVGKLRSLAVGGFRLAAVEELRRLARGIQASSPQPWRPSRRASALGDVAEEARALRATMTTAVEKALYESDDARLWLDVVHHATGEAVDLMCDLRILADLHRRHASELAREVSGYDAADTEARARACADALDGALAGDSRREEQEARDKLARAWTVFTATYEEVCRAARFAVAARGGEAAVFASLATIARVERRQRTAQKDTSGSWMRRSASPQAHAALDVAAAGLSLPRPPLLPGGGGAAPRRQGPPPLPPAVAAAAATTLVDGDGGRDDDDAPKSRRVITLRPSAADWSVPPPSHPLPNVPVARVRGAAEPDPFGSARRAPSAAPRVPPPLPDPVGDAPAPAPPPVPHDDAAAARSEPPPPAPVAESEEAASPVEESPVPSSTDRAAPRHRIELEVSIFSDSNFYAGFTENLSAGGVFVATYVLRPIGSRMTLEILVPGRTEPLRLAGVVRWLRPPSANEDLWPGMGVAFDALSAEEEASIRAFLGEREPMFFDD